jgi:hypothetical protein
MRSEGDRREVEGREWMRSTLDGRGKTRFEGERLATLMI